MANRTTKRNFTFKYNIPHALLNVFFPLAGSLADIYITRKLASNTHSDKSYQERHDYKIHRNTFAAAGVGGSAAILLTSLSAHSVIDSSLLNKSVTLNHWNGFNPDHSFSSQFGVDNLDGMLMFGFLVITVLPWLVRGLSTYSTYSILDDKKKADAKITTPNRTWSSFNFGLFGNGAKFTLSNQHSALNENHSPEISLHRPHVANQDFAVDSKTDHFRAGRNISNTPPEEIPNCVEPEQREVSAAAFLNTT